MDLLVQHRPLLGGPAVKFFASVPRGLSNLFLVGAWTRNGRSYGCVEAAVMSGRQAARAISGAPLVVFGE
jgi:uncharacterized protein with NAD-binding domain and iron-sulfur cluster